MCEKPCEIPHFLQPALFAINTNKPTFSPYLKFGCNAHWTQKTLKNPYSLWFPKSRLGAHFKKYNCLFPAPLLYHPIIFTTHRPSDLGFPIRWPILISGSPRCPDFTSRKVSEGDVKAVPRTAPRLYREAACQYHSRTNSGPKLPLTTLVYRPPTSRLRHAHVMPSQRRVSARPAIAPTCPPPQQSPWTTHRPPRHPSILDPTRWRHVDVIRPRPHLLTSFKKRANSPNLHIFTKIHIFSHFYQKNYSSLCMHFMTISPPTCRIRFKDCGRPEFTCICYHCQKFTRYLSKFPFRAWFFL